MTELEPLRLKPILKERVWGGNRLDPSAADPIGEAWVVYEENQVEGGPWDGRFLGSLAEEHSVNLLGTRVVERSGRRFPLLIKLLDSRDWLSVQVHPDDRHAVLLEGPGNLGKTEAWYILEAEPGARLISGLTGSPTRESLRDAAEAGALEQYLNFVDVRAGDAIFTPAGRVHAIGPGLFIYEVQQTSDITYRLFDWNRPASQGRELHLEKGFSVVATEPLPSGVPSGAESEGPVNRLVECPYFALDRIQIAGSAEAFATGGESFHVLTATSEEAMVRTERGAIPLMPYETVLVPAAIMEYEISAELPCELLRAHVV